MLLYGGKRCHQHEEKILPFFIWNRLLGLLVIIQNIFK